MNVEGVLSEIDTNKCDVLHDGLSVKGIYLNSVLLLRWGGPYHYPQRSHLTRLLTIILLPNLQGELVL
ncbi:hypothetical protein C9Z62_16515 [Escherichia coli]|nr:hypothetical protein C9Z62_16515 [Escherichia coli]